MDSDFFIKFLAILSFINGVSLIISDESRRNLIINLKKDSFIISMGYISILIGAPFVILHNIWEFSVVGLVTFFGWLTLFKGFILVCFPKLVSNKSYSLKTLKIRGVFSFSLSVLFFYYGYF